MPPRESHKQPYYMAARRYSWAVRQKQSSAVHTYVRRATASATVAAAATTTAVVTGKLWSPRSFTCEMQLSSSHLNWKRASTAIWVATCARAKCDRHQHYAAMHCSATHASAATAAHRRRASNRKEGSATLTIAKYTVSCVHHNNLAFACSIACTVYGFFYE